VVGATDFPDLPMTGLRVGLMVGGLVGVGLLLPALPMPAISAPSIPPKENERERSADIDTSSTRARIRLSSLRPRKIPWALTVSVAIAAKRKKLDTRMVVWMVLLARWKSDNLLGRYLVFYDTDLLKDVGRKSDFDD
jgi:hypothetical protein